MTQEALQESIISDFSKRLNKKKGEFEVTSIKEVSPYRMMSLDVLEKKLEEDEEYREYVDTWDGPDGPDSRFTFVQGNHHDPETDTFDLDMPPKVYLARYTVQSFNDHFDFPASQFAHNISSAVH